MSAGGRTAELVPFRRRECDRRAPRPRPSARAGFRQKCNVLQGSTNKALFTLPANSGRSPPRGSRPDADPQAAEQRPAHPGLHVESPAGLGHEHARRQAAQQQQ